MITDLLLDLIEGLVGWIATLLPVDTVFGSQNMGFQIFNNVNYFFPLAELSSVVLGVIALGLPMAGVSLILWLLVSVIRGGGAKS